MKKYLDIKAAKQPKPLVPSSSASAPSVTSTAQTNDVLSRSDAAPQGHGKSNSTSSPTSSSGTTFTRVERSTKTGKPASSEASSKPSSSKPQSTVPPTDSELVLPPPLPQKSSSGPVRPPPAMRPPMPATSSAVSSRLLTGRQASRVNLRALNSAAVDITKSQLATYEDTKCEPLAASTVVPAAPESVQPKHAKVEPFTKRSTGGPRRVPKPEGVVAPPNPARAASVPPPAPRKPTDGSRDSSKGEEKERSTSSSTSSATIQEQKPVFTRPPEPVAPTAPEVGEKGKRRAKELVRDFEVPLQGEEERVQEPRKSSESRSGELRPSSRAGKEHRRTASREQELYSRPTSRMEECMHQRTASREERPPSRMDGEGPFCPESRAGAKRPESRAEQAETKADKKLGEELDGPAQKGQTQKAVDPEALARREERRRRRAAEQAALEARAQSDALAQARREEKRRRREQAAAAQTAVAQQQPVQAESAIDPAVAVRREEKRRRRELAAAQQQQALLQAQSQGETAVDLAAPAKLEERVRRREEHEAARAAGKRPKDERVGSEKPAKKRRNDTNLAIQQELDGMQAEAMKAAKQLKLAAMATERDVDEDEWEAPVRTEEVEVQPAHDTKQECRSQDLAPTTGKLPEGSSNSTSSCNEEKVSGAAPIMTDDSHTTVQKPHAQETVQFKPSVKLVSNPPSPPNEACVPRPFETPAPLRQAIASRRYQVPATPISRLLDTIQRGFDPDFSMIGEESEADLGFSSKPREAQVNDGDPACQRAASNNTTTETMEGGQNQAVFVDTRPRKLKSSHDEDKEKKARDRTR